MYLKIRNILPFIILALIVLQTGCSPQAAMDSNDANWQTFPPNVISPEIQHIQASIPSYNRLITSTYLTYPEWYIVYSSQEYANYLKSQLP
ncbi:MAG: hypothetical protein JO131_01970, partial [Gammaproteobacteria bacterium]|nr:hypothetical protein [Gammaproteobacteria bacterium]